MGVAIYDAAKIAKNNRKRLEKLQADHERLTLENKWEAGRQDRVRRLIVKHVLDPFADALSRLKNVDLAELEALDSPGVQEPDVELQRIRVSASGAVGSLAGGAALGAGAGALTFAAVGALATASTGAAISGLSGAAATSATLAWLGGGSLAAGGGGVAAGTAVLTGIVAAPVLIAAIGFAEYKGRQARRQQREVAAELSTAEAALRTAQTRCAAVRERSQDVRAILERLHKVSRGRVEDFGTLVSAKDDYLSFTPEERADLAVTVSLVTTIVAVMQAPLFDEQGVVTDLSKYVVEDASLRLDALDAEAA